jgi:3-deoxy-7-phosphoheptulonate synthase
MNDRSTRAELEAVERRLAQSGVEARVIGNAIVALKGDAPAIEQIRELPGVASVEPLRSSHKLVTRRVNPDGTLIQIGDLKIGGDEFTVIAGPCAVESESQIVETALAVARAGARMLRGGAYKPRTSPYSFQGLGAEGLSLLAKAGREAGLATITEVIAPGDVELVAEHVDVLQVGARNAQNYEMLKALGRVAKPVLLKRGLAETIEELMFAAEYIIYHGNPNVMFCERGLRTFETATRNTLDLGAAALLKQLTHLPVIVDPSHGTGRRELIAPLTKAAAAAGADGVMIEQGEDFRRRQR